MAISMADLSLRVVGIGAATPFGEMIAAAAAFRAGMSRARTVPWLTIELPEEGQVPVIGHPAWPAEEGLEHLAAWARLAGMAIEDLCERTAITPTDWQTTGMITS